MASIRNFVIDSLTRVVNNLLIKNVTWSELVGLRDINMLIKGSKYRITDYACTTTQADTQSANHPFDIIVTADSENTLNENARAIQHSGDTYFANSNLAAWELKYSLDNDTTKFAWADSGSTGRGVIYWMKDEWNNECPYDFKNIRFSVQPTFEANAYGATNTYTKNGTVINIDNVNYYGYTRTRTAQGYPAPPEQLYVTETVLQTSMSLYTVTNNVATLYTTATVDSVTNVNYEPYTFDSFGEDASMSLTKNCYSNIIGEFINNGGLQELNRIIFRSTVSSGIFNCYSNTIKLNCRNMTFDYGCHSNTFGDGCYDNTFGSGCYGNVIGNGCYNNKFGNNYQYNTFGNKCYSNTFGYDCNYNTFGNQCYSNTFGNSGSYNSFGNNCYYNKFGNTYTANSFGNNCNYNTIGNNFYYNAFGNQCYYNDFGIGCLYNTLVDNCYFNSFGNNCFANILENNCYSNRFGTWCQSNTIGTGSYSNIFGGNCCYNRFGNNCCSNTFGDSCSHNTVGNGCNNIKFGTASTAKAYCTNNIIENGNRYIYIDVTSTTSSSTPYRNVKIAQGVNNTSTYKTITDGNVNQTFQTVYQPANSNIISI